MLSWRASPVQLETLGTATLIQTALNTGDRLLQKSNVKFTKNIDGHGTTVDIGSVAGEPEILGFGGAFTESAATVFKSLRPELQKQVLEDYFGADGLGYTIGRVHINSCDFSLDSYSFDDVDGDLQLAHFDDGVTRDQKVLIPLILAAKQMMKERGQGLRLFASPWSPPGWMKTNGKMDGTLDPCLRPEARSSWANYISRWITAYKRQGVEFWALTVQNEPEWNDARYEMCHFSPEQEAEFLSEFLGPILRSAHPNLSILIFDDNKQDVHTWAYSLYGNPKSAPFIDGVAFHWYTGDHFENVRHVRNAFPNAVLLPTEATFIQAAWPAGDKVKHGEWQFGEGYAHDIMGDLNAGANGWVDWNLLLDEHGGPNHAGNTCDATLRANISAQELYYHPQYYFMGHFSKYILPGSRRLNVQVRSTTRYSGPTRAAGTCTGEDGLDATGFLRPDGRAAVVVLNCGDSALEFKLLDGSKAIDTSIPAHAVQTYLFEHAVDALV